MRRVIETDEFWNHSMQADDGAVMVELDGSPSSVEVLWRMVLGMAMKDRAWCIQYDINHPLRLLNVTSRSVYGLVPPPDEMAELMVHAIDRVTKSTSAFAQLLSTIRLLFSGRITRSFLVTHDGETAAWVVSWPRCANDGPVVLFRETYPGPDQSHYSDDEVLDSGNDVGDRN